MSRSVSGCTKPGYKAATHPVPVKAHKKPSQTGGVHIKTMLVDALKQTYPLPELLPVLRLARSSYFYHRARLLVGDRHAGARRVIADIFECNHRCYGYRRIRAALNRQQVFISEKVVRRLMRQEGLAAATEIFKLVVASTKKFQAAFLSWLGRCGAAPWLSM